MLLLRLESSASVLDAWRVPMFLVALALQYMSEIR